MMLLGFHQDVQRKVLEELDAVFGEDLERSVSMEDLNNLKYTEQVIKESLRLYPVVPFVPRNTTEDIKITNYTLPKGCDLLFNIYSLHRNPKIYPNPDEFDPENFSPERSKGRHPYSFLPFSGGLRKCVGYKYAMLQMKIVLATVLRHFTIQPAYSPCEERVRCVPSASRPVVGLKGVPLDGTSLSLRGGVRKYEAVQCRSRYETDASKRRENERKAGLESVSKRDPDVPDLKKLRIKHK
uniref:Cytochrome P450 n=1 Tax=Timema bartmani TaxID=61472 RepID=A0A7R9FDW9_9NEOP|nr:unnamed protein product [Timema bartmani]